MLAKIALLIVYDVIGHLIYIFNIYLNISTTNADISK